MSHADAVREAEKRVLEAADALLDEGAHELKAWSECCRRDCERCKADSALYRAASEHRAIRAATCPQCGGTGRAWDNAAFPEGWDDMSGDQQMEVGLGGWGACPHCNEGRRRDAS